MCVGNAPGTSACSHSLTPILSAPLLLRALPSPAPPDFPMRVVIASDAAPTRNVTFRYKLIYNIAGNYLPYPIASDLYGAPAFQDLIDREASGQPTNWYRNLTDYLHVARPRYQLFDLLLDESELVNVAGDPAYSTILAALSLDIKNWQTATEDDWVIKCVHSAWHDRERSLEQTNPQR